VRSFTVLIIVPVLVCTAAATAHAEQAAVELTPRFAANKPLTVEIRNLSKLPVTLHDVTLHLATGANAAPCTFAMAQSVALGPAQMKVITLGANRDVLRCIPHPVTRQASVMTTRDLPRLAPRHRLAGNPLLHPADVNYRMDIGKRTLADKTTWHFAVE
jgi:hypothetical protein